MLSAIAHKTLQIMELTGEADVSRVLTSESFLCLSRPLRPTSERQKELQCSGNKNKNTTILT